MTEIMQIVLGVLIPPLGVFLVFGFGSTFLISIGLTLLGWIPGSIHAVWAIVKHQEKEQKLAHEMDKS